MASWVSFLIKNAELNDSFVFEVHRALCIEESWLIKLSQTSSPRDATVLPDDCSALGPMDERFTCRSQTY